MVCPGLAYFCVHMRDFIHNDVSVASLKGKLVDAERLLLAVWEPECRPSLRWLRGQTKANTIPYIKLGHLVFFDVDLVRAALAARNLRKHRSQGKRCETRA